MRDTINISNTYRNLVIAGASIVKDLKVINAMDSGSFDEVFEDGQHLADALNHLVNVAADISAEDEFFYDMAKIYYADIISVYAYDEELGEKYIDLFWKMNNTEADAKEELDDLCKSIPNDIHYWVRRNI